MINKDIIAIQAEAVHWAINWGKLDDPPCPKCGGLTMSFGRGKIVCKTCPWKQEKETQNDDNQ